MRPLPPLARGALAFAAGLLAGFRIPVPDHPIPLTLAATAVIAVALRRQTAPAVPIAFAAAGIVLGCVAARDARVDCRAGIPDGARLRVRGALEAAPVDGRTARLRVAALRIDRRSHGCAGTIRVAGLDETVRDVPAAGAEVVGWGRWWATPPRGDWPRRPRWSGMLLLDSLRAPTATTAGRSPVLALRGGVQRRLRRLFGERSGLAEALILAERAGLDPDVRERFVRAGLVHVLAISGMHVGLIAGVLLLIGGVLRLTPRAATVAAVAVVLLYVGFLGAPAAATRAALQIGLLSTGRLLQRPSDPFAAMAAAAIVLLALDPLAVMSAGFQLSFLGAAGIIALRRPILRAIPPVLPRVVRDGFAASLAALLATAPVAALHFGRVAPVGAVATLAAVPLVALAVPTVALALFASIVSDAAGRFIAGAADLAFVALDRVAAVAAASPGAGTYVPRDTALGWLVAGAVLVHLLRRGGRLRRPVARWTAAGTALALLIAWPVLARALGGDALEIHAIDVGQGDALAIRSPAGRWMLIDAGPRTAGYDAGAARVVPFLLRHSVHRLDALVVTHPDADHIGGARAVLDAFDVGTIIAPGLAVGKSMYLSTLAAARRSGARWVAARPGREIDWDGARIRVLFPDDASVDAAETANNVSVVLHVAYGRFAALFLGDVPAAVERRLVDRYGAGLRSGVLKIAHHGSATSTSVGLLRSVRPEIALISVGRRNRYGHPDRSVVRRLEGSGIRILRTDRMGSVAVRAWRDGRIETTTERAETR